MKKIRDSVLGLIGILDLFEKIVHELEDKLIEMESLDKNSEEYGKALKDIGDLKSKINKLR